MCSVRRKRWRLVTVQPKNTQTHQSRCRNKTASTSTRAARIDGYLSLRVANQLSAELDSAMRENGK
jgi:hypothetical protein